MKELNSWIAKKTNFWIQRRFPTSAVYFASKYFKGKEIICAEVGVFEGENSLNMLKFLNVKKHYAIDPYLVHKDFEGDKLNFEGILLRAKKKAHKRLDNFKNIVWIEKKSSDAVKDIKEGLDFIYIDGNHSYKAVKEDLNNYWKKINLWGIMSGDDFGQLDVARAVCEFAYKNKLILNTNKEDWWFVK